MQSLTGPVLELQNNALWDTCPNSLDVNKVMYVTVSILYGTLGGLKPECITRIGQGMFMACVNPLLLNIVDLRHDSQYIWSY